MTFALLLARSEGIPLTRAGDGTVVDRGLHEVGDELGHSHSLMGRALQVLTDNLSANFRVTLDLLVRVTGAVEWDRIRAGQTDAYVLLYEEFLGVYDEALRRASGTYYTPRAVVDQMVRLVDDVLRQRLGQAEGFWSKDVFTVDPAMGTGTFLHAIIQRVGEQVGAQEGPGAVPQAIERLARRLAGFEMQMGPYAVAELRSSDLVRRYHGALPAGGLTLCVTNTLDDPFVEEQQLGSTYAAVSRSRRRANEIKAKTPVTVVLGNPPYRERAEGLGGWVEQGSPNHPAPLDAFRLAGNGRTEYVLKNLYIYFWRWATWKVFDAHPDDRSGVVAFISTAGYLRGPGFKGMREYLRRTCAEGWIIDLTPEGMQPDVPTRVFPGVQQPLAIGVFIRRPDTVPEKPAPIWYAAVHGQREAKFAALAGLALDGPGWRPARTGWTDPFTPAADSAWDDFPALGDLLPWVAPGVKPNRTWVYAPSPETLAERWAALVAEPDRDRRRELFKESRDQKLDTTVGPLPGFPEHPDIPDHHGTIGEEHGPCPAPVRVAYRSLDRQWLIPDSRAIDRPRPDLWRARTPGQVFVSEQHTRSLTTGPGLVFSALIPDMDHFKGSEGGRVLPGWHPGGAPNVPAGLLTTLGERLGHAVPMDDLLAYLGGVAAHRGFVPRFAAELVTPGIRVPLTADPALWARAVDLGRQVIWLHTYGERCADPAAGRPERDIRYPAGDPRRVLNTETVPASPLPAELAYDGPSEAGAGGDSPAGGGVPGHDSPDHDGPTGDGPGGDGGTPRVGGTLRVGAGAFQPVPAAVWEYDIGGTPVVRKWFSYRKANPGGRVSSPLDTIHAQRWPYEWTVELTDLLTVLARLVELEPAQDALLTEIVAGPQLTVADLTAAGVFPVPPVARKAHLHAPDPATPTHQPTIIFP